MASDVMSLFGLDPNTIQQNRTNKAVSQASAMNPYFAAGAAGGALVGQGINSMFGLQTPDMAQAQGVQDSLQGTDLSTPTGMRQAARQLMMNGDYSQAMALHSRANELEAEGTAATNLEQDRSLGQTSDMVVQQSTPASIDGMIAATPAIKHTVTRNYDGSIDDATLGESFGSYAEWMVAVRESLTDTAVGTDGKPNAEEVMANATFTAEELLNPQMNTQASQELEVRVKSNVDALQAQIDSLPPEATGARRALQERLANWLEKLPQITQEEIDSRALETQENINTLQGMIDKLAPSNKRGRAVLQKRLDAELANLPQ